jgi:hypothetical protein
MHIQPRDKIECVAATWQDILIFMVINYVTHAMTVKSLPGEQTSAVAFYRFLALLFPFTGAWRGLRAIRLAAVFGEDDLKRAARAGALCIVARSAAWQPEKERIPGCTIRGIKLIDSTTLRPKARVIVCQGQEFVVNPIQQSEVYIHGQCLLPDGYHLVRLPENVVVSSLHEKRVTIATGPNLAKVVASVFQLTYGVLTLYRSKANQLDRYGYAAFALTVIPYGIMSVVNLLGNLLTPDYQSLYIVRTEELAEAERRGGKFDGTIGTVRIDPDQTQDDTNGYDIMNFDGRAETLGMFFYEDGVGAKYTYSDGPPEIVVPSVGGLVRRDTSSWDKGRRVGMYFIAGLSWIAPYAIIGGLTKFDPGSSTESQRFWVMSWLIVGQCAGVLLAGVMDGIDGAGRRITVFISGGLFIVPAIGGFITVGNMMKEFGRCVEI